MGVKVKVTVGVLVMVGVLEGMLVGVLVLVKVLVARLPVVGVGVQVLPKPLVQTVGVGVEVGGQGTVKGMVVIFVQLDPSQKGYPLLVSPKSIVITMILVMV